MAIPVFSNYISRRTGGPQSVLVEVSLEGLGDVATELGRLETAGPVELGRALYAEALLIMAQAKRLVPVRFGILRASGHVLVPKTHGEHVEVEMGFGGPAGIGNQGESNRENVGYALPVHENLTARHTVGQAKYLEHPTLAAITGLEGRLAVRIKKDLGL